MKFFFDNNISYRLALAIGALATDSQDQVFHLLDRFPAATQDEEWLEALISDNALWSVVTLDGGVPGHLMRVEAVSEAKIIVVSLDSGWNKHGLLLQMSRLCLWWPNIVDAVNNAKVGTIFNVPYRFTGGAPSRHRIGK